MAYFVLMCYGHSILSPSLTLPINTTLAKLLPYWPLRSSIRASITCTPTSSIYSWLHQHQETPVCTELNCQVIMWDYSHRSSWWSSIWIAAMLNLQNFEFCQCPCWVGNLHPSTKFDPNWIIQRWYLQIKLFFKMAAVRHIEFAKIAVLVTPPISACDSSSPLQTSL